MKFQISEKDKKTLFFLGMFVIIVCFSYWGIRPLYKGIQTIAEEKQLAEETRFENEAKLSMLDFLAADNEQLKLDAVEARKNFYPMMTTDEIDKLFTGMALDYNLEALDLSIGVETKDAELGAYRYAAPKEVAEEYYDEYDEWDAMSDVAYYDKVPTGVRAASISMRLGGEEENLQKLIDDLSASEKELLINSYRWSVQSYLVLQDDNTYKTEYTTDLRLSLNIYMYEEE